MTALKMIAVALAGVALLPAAAHAEKIPNKAAVFAFLDKVTARISKKAVPIGQTVQFGSLKVTARACFTRPATEEPKTTGFVEVQDVKLDGTEVGIFSGWMLAQSPGLHAVEHPVYDVWLADCDKPAGTVVAAKPAAKPAKSAKAAAADALEAGAEESIVDPDLEAAAVEAEPGGVDDMPDAVVVKKRRLKRQ